MDCHKQDFYLVVFFLRSSGNEKPVQKHFVYRNRYVLARFYRDHLRQVLLDHRGEPYERDKRGAVRDGNRGVRCRDIGLAYDIFKRFGDFFCRQGSCAAYLDTRIGAQSYCAVRFQNDGAALFAQLHNLDGRGPYVHAERAFRLFFEKIGEKRGHDVIYSSMLLEIFTPLLDLIVPPRRTERLVRALNMEVLQELKAASEGRGLDGSLPYHDPRVTALVWELKYYANRPAAVLAGEVLAEELLALAGEELGKPLLVPVPMHSARRRLRGHNQTELLCGSALRSLGEAGKGGFEYVPNALIRIQNTRMQQGLERSKRLENVKNSMTAPKPKIIEGRVCVVVDDVTTTGATLKEARRALRSAGARRVHCLALARS